VSYERSFEEHGPATGFFEDTPLFLEREDGQALPLPSSASSTSRPGLPDREQAQLLNTAFVGLA
jgi:hypothetical protein